MPLTPGSSLGDYEIRRPLGAGGMGEVYLAHDTKLGRKVAIKVGPGRRVLLRMARDGSGVQIAVIDEGPGIDSAALPRLFHSFFTTKKGGMGLGLSIVRSIIEAHEGRVWAENNPGGGAAFRIVLPAALPAERPPQGV